MSSFEYNEDRTKSSAKDIRITYNKLTIMLSLLVKSEFKLSHEAKCKD